MQASGSHTARLASSPTQHQGVQDDVVLRALQRHNWYNYGEFATVEYEPHTDNGFMKIGYASSKKKRVQAARLAAVISQRQTEIQSDNDFWLTTLMQPIRVAYGEMNAATVLSSVVCDISDS